MENAILLGRVSSVDYKKGCADVVFCGMEDDIRGALPCMSSEYNMPDVGDMVVCAFSHAGKGSQGVILGSIYNDENVPSQSGNGVYFKRLSKKAFIRYNPETEVLEIRAPKVVLVQD